MTHVYNAFHRATLNGDVVGDGRWKSWHEAANDLMQNGLAGFVHGIFVLMPLANIEMEIVYP